MSNPDYDHYITICKDIESAKQSNDPEDILYLQFHSEWAVAEGLHPDAIAASPLPH